VSTTQEAVLPVGSVFAGRYRIKSFLGEGDRKRTYLADDAVFPREVALALIKPDAAQSDPEGRRREAEALAPAGRNDNVVTFHDSGTAEGTEYLAFDYLSGGNLREHLAKHAEIGKQLSVEEVMLLGPQPQPPTPPFPRRPQHCPPKRAPVNAAAPGKAGSPGAAGTRQFSRRSGVTPGRDDSQFVGPATLTAPCASFITPPLGSTRRRWHYHGRRADPSSQVW
jgi:hypothetical protein